MNKSSLTFVFISISILTFILGSWQLFRLNWKNDLMDNINNSIINPDLFSNDNKYNNLVSVKLDKNYTILDNRYRFVCRLDIIDNGPGVSQDMTDQIFFPLVSKRSGGTGLGLTIAQTAITRHKGAIECSSEPGDTIFSIYLPLGE